MNLFNTNKINRVFPINLEQTDKVKGGGYLVEISQTTPGVFSYFLVTPNVQKELVNASSSYYENVNTPCSITKYLTTGNERGLQRKLQDKLGYLILGGDCHGYSSGNFVSVYRLTDANKVELYGNFKLPWIEGSPGGISSGNALGTLIGVYGITQPTIIVNYGSTSPANVVEGLYQTVYFDLQTGKLDQLVKFN